MKNLITVFFIVTILFISQISFCQWQNDLRLTNNSSRSWLTSGNVKSIAASGTVIHVVWQDDRDGNWEIYYLRSPDNGESWGSETRLTNNSSTSEYPSVCVEGSFVHVVWQDNRDGNSEIYYKRSINGGLNWSSDTRMTFNSTVSSHPSIAASNGYVNMVWQDNSPGDYEIYSYYSTNNGTNWSSFQRLTNNSSTSEYPCVGRNSNYVYCAWVDNRDGNKEIYSKHSMDGGVSWYSDTRVTNNPGNSLYPSITGAGSNLTVVWQDDRDGSGNTEIYYNTSINTGTYWGTERRLTNNQYSSLCPSVVASGNNIHVVWSDNRDNSISAETYYKKSPDNCVSWGSDTKISNASSFTINPSIAVSGTNLFVDWQDTRNAATGEIYFKKNPTGNPIGIQNISSEIPCRIALFQNYPNPFNSSTKIKIQLKETGYTKLIIYDITGKEVKNLIQDVLQPGTYSIGIDASDLPSGTYFYRLCTPDFSESRKLILLK